MRIIPLFAAIFMGVIFQPMLVMCNEATIEKKGIVEVAQISLERSCFIEATKVKDLCQQYDLSVEELLPHLLPFAKTFSKPTISNYPVGAVALGKSGNVYLGANIEFAGQPLNQTIHAEQFLVANARNHGETELLAIALSASPCGHCRQFMREMGEGKELKFYINQRDPITLAALLPQSFGPEDLGFKGGLLAIPKSDLIFTMDYSLRTLARIAAHHSYAPYSGAKSGATIQVVDGQIYSGSYLETVAFNPSLSPMQVAIIALLADGCDYSDISEALLFEQIDASISHENTSRELLKSVSRGTNFQYIYE